jgi:hypothetical protein
MAESSRKQSLIAELRTARIHVSGYAAVVRRDLDVRARVKTNYSRNPLAWYGAAAVVGFALSRLLLSRSKGVEKGAEVQYYKVEKPGKWSLLLTILKLGMSLAKPAIAGFLANKIQNKTP